MARKSARRRRPYVVTTNGAGAADGSAARPAPRTAARSRRPGRRTPRPWWAWGAVGAAGLAFLGIAFLLLHGVAPAEPTLTERSRSAPVAGPADAAALRAIKKVSSSPFLDGGKPVVFFMGGQFCPFCAADRWSFVKATSRFGTWTGLRSLHSKGGTDGFASLPTYDLTQATFQSELLSIRVREVADVNGNPLQSLRPDEQQLVNQYDPGGGIPFTIVGGSMGEYKVDLAFSPGLIQGISFDSLRADVDGDGKTQAALAIDGSADALTALICKLTGGRPDSVCSTEYIQGLVKQIQ
jgi:hypothetical protein